MLTQSVVAFLSWLEQSALRMLSFCFCCCACEDNALISGHAMRHSLLLLLLSMEAWSKTEALDWGAPNCLLSPSLHSCARSFLSSSVQCCRSATGAARGRHVDIFSLSALPFVCHFHCLCCFVALYLCNCEWFNCFGALWGSILRIWQMAMWCDLSLLIHWQCKCQCWRRKQKVSIFSLLYR